MLDQGRYDTKGRERKQKEGILGILFQAEFYKCGVNTVRAAWMIRMRTGQGLRSLSFVAVLHSHLSLQS
jgi:hypothetical protein